MKIIYSLAALAFINISCGKSDSKSPSSSTTPAKEVSFSGFTNTSTTKSDLASNINTNASKVESSIGSLNLGTSAALTEDAAEEDLSLKDTYAVGDDCSDITTFASTFAENMLESTKKAKESVTNISDDLKSAEKAGFTYTDLKKASETEYAFHYSLAFGDGEGDSAMSIEYAAGASTTGFVSMSNVKSVDEQGDDIVIGYKVKYDSSAKLASNSVNISSVDFSGTITTELKTETTTPEFKISIDMTDKVEGAMKGTMSYTKGSDGKMTMAVDFTDGGKARSGSVTMAQTESTCTVTASTLK